MRSWVRYGVIAGIIAFASTVAANSAITLVRPSDLCRIGPLSIPLLHLGALLVFLLMAAAAGFASGLKTGSVADATLAGVLVGVIAGVALLTQILFLPAVMNRLQELSALCPDGGSISFGPTPPPGFVPPTPPPGAFAPPFASPARAALQIIGMLFSIAIGTALAAGAAAVAGLVGAAARR